MPALFVLIRGIGTGFSNPPNEIINGGFVTTASLRSAHRNAEKKETYALLICLCFVQVFLTTIHHQQKEQAKCLLFLLVGDGGFGPPKLNSNRFTVCPLWPLGKSPR